MLSINCPVALAVLQALLLVVNGQMDKTFCDPDKIVPGIGSGMTIPQFPPPSKKYQAFVEKNIGNAKSTEEMREYYDGINEIGIAVTSTFDLGSIYSYNYYKTDELLMVKDLQCSVYKLSEMYDLSPFFVTTTPDGKEHIVSPLAYILKLPNIIWIGNSTVRGIAVHQFQTCTYLEKTKKTGRITISYSDPTWPMPGFMGTSVPVEVKVDWKIANKPEVSTEFYEIYSFKDSLDITTEDYYPKSGVYCKDRVTNKNPIPTFPSAFSYTAHITTSAVDQDNKAGEFSVVKGEHDFDKKLFRKDFFENGQKMVEIHDLDAGLNYRINMAKNKCQIDKFAVEYPSSEALFFANASAGSDPFQYLGRKRIRNIDTDVWIAPRSYMSMNGTWEWHFMANGWIVQEDNGVGINEPMLLKMNLDLGDSKTLPMSVELGVFDQNRINLFDFDIGNCEDKIGNAHFRFTIDADATKYQLIQTNQKHFKEGLIKAIQSITKVSLMRISKLELIFDNGVVYVTFTIFEKPSFYGNTNKHDENSLQDATNLLTNAITNQNTVIDFMISTEERNSILVKKGSLIKLEVRDGRFIYKQTDVTNSGYSGGALFGFIIGFLAIGLILGLISATFLFIRNTKPLKLPARLSIFNPNFNTSGNNTELSSSA